MQYLIMNITQEPYTVWWQSCSAAGALASKIHLRPTYICISKLFMPSRQGNIWTELLSNIAAKINNEDVLMFPWYILYSTIDLPLYNLWPDLD